VTSCRTSRFLLGGRTPPPDPPGLWGLSFPTPSRVLGGLPLLRPCRLGGRRPPTPRGFLLGWRPPDTTKYCTSLGESAGVTDARKIHYCFAFRSIFRIGLRVRCWCNRHCTKIPVDFKEFQGQANASTHQRLFVGVLAQLSSRCCGLPSLHCVHSVASCRSRHGVQLQVDAGRLGHGGDLAGHIVCGPHSEAIVRVVARCAACSKPGRGFGANSRPCSELRARVSSTVCGLLGTRPGVWSKVLARAPNLGSGFIARCAACAKPCRGIGASFGPCSEPRARVYSKACGLFETRPGVGARFGPCSEPRVPVYSKVCGLLETRPGA
jgi:hypothetical protein